MALQAASLKEKTIQEVEPMRKYHDTSLNVKGYLLIYLILYIFLPLNRYRHPKLPMIIGLRNNPMIIGLRNNPMVDRQNLR